MTDDSGDDSTSQFLDDILNDLREFSRRSEPDPVPPRIPASIASTTAKMAALDSAAELTKLLEEWERTASTPATHIPILTQLAELFEKETEAYYKMDPDPFDDRHPGRANPNSSLGHLLKTIAKNDNFMTQLVADVRTNRRDQSDLTNAGCRLLLDLMPGLEMSTLFPDDIEGPIDMLFQCVEHADEPLRSYATGLLACGVTKIQNVTPNFKEQNANIVPILLKRLHELKKKCEERDAQTSNTRHFGMFGSTTPTSTNENSGMSTLKVPFESPPKHSKGNISVSEISSSSWAEQEPYVIGSCSMYPLTDIMKQRLILQYLTPVVEYQDLLSTVFEHNSLELIMYYIDIKRNRDIRLAFDALKYLATLLCHRKFMIEFIAVGGVEKLLAVPRPSVAATGVSLCLYYLSYFEDAMERVCLLPQNVLNDLVSYALWLMECSHESSRCHSAMFFGHSFIFHIITKLFDQKKGLRILYNMISILEILHTNETEHFTEDKIFTNRQAVRHVCAALKKYFESHLCAKADEIRSSHIRNYGGSPLAESPAYKATKYTPEVIQENVDLLLELLPLNSVWKPVEEFNKLGGLSLIAKTVAASIEWTNYMGRADTMRYAIDVMTICTVVPKSLQVMVDSITLPDGRTTQPISILLCVAEEVSDPEVSKSALNAIINCACGPDEKLGGGAGRVLTSSIKKRVTWKVTDVLTQIWSAIQANDGIMVLLKLLNIKTPVTDADAIRTLACKALVGFTRCETIRQIVSRLPMFTDGQLQQLTKEPILQDKRREHIKYFCKYANELFEQVTGKRQNLMNASLEEIKRADIVAQTKIMYEANDLLLLIHNHLQSTGFPETANMLHREANLPTCSTPPLIHPASPHIYSTPTQPSNTRHLRPTTNTTTLPHHPTTPSHHPTPTTQDIPQTQTSDTRINHEPIRVNLSRSHTLNSPCNTHTPNRLNGTPAPTTRQSRFVREPSFTSHHIATPSTSRKLCGNRPPHKNSMTLDKLVCDYLRKQHAYCRHPVSTCPQMSLFVPHRCPDPLHKNSAPTNITARLLKRSIFPKFAGPDGAKCDRRYVYSRFRSVRVYRGEEEDSYSSCAFSACQEYMVLGTFNGEIKVVEISTGEERGSYECHDYVVNSLEPSKDGHTLLSSSAWGRPLSVLWSATDTFTKLHSFEDQYMEFSKQVQDRIVGTKDQTAKIYDVSTGQMVVKLYDDERRCDYAHNRATFNPTDDLILNDGVLWDVRSNQVIHRFDKFNPNISGVFHPIDLEIIINTEVWDMRTFHLLHTVPTLDQCRIKFSNSGDILYGALDQRDDTDFSDDKLHAFYGSVFRTFDATNYNSIATYDVKKNILDLCTDEADRYLALIEATNQKRDDIVNVDEEGVCRLYEVGKLKDAEDDQIEEEEEITMEEEEDETSRLSGDEASGDDNAEEDNENEDNQEDQEGDDDDDEAPIILDASSSDDNDDDDDDDDVILAIGSGDDSDDDVLFDLADL